MIFKAEIRAMEKISIREESHGANRIEIYLQEVRKEVHRKSAMTSKNPQQLNTVYK